MESLSVIRKFYQKNRRNTRCGIGAGKTSPKRPTGDVRDGFLKHRFLPFTGYNLQNRAKAETEFFRSVENLCGLYGLTVPDVSGQPFPQNISEAHAALTEKLQAAKGIGCYIMQDETRMATLATAKRYDTGYCLYYIPVRPLARIGEKKELKALYKLVCLICAYLYQITKVNYYRENDYINSTYYTIELDQRRRGR
ncbi:hypothetical protein MTO98_26125 [Mucilaginibacter sp. SMC90]|uniref:hypothetical protein n=1 Tax=Mucilaginibacter sp. SMC90 TaxID=2929803 RepID=UPI001FB2A5CE|nr:hypothetical protein [Mucilaginibacter sp. SMC90]UOE47892.1 hypothetical protein MTO98_26125 [Mucilaginibacter sp. SMC90]